MEAGTAPSGAAGEGRLKPLDIGQTLDAAVNLYSKNAITLWKLVAIVIVPIEVIEVLLRRVTLPSDVFLSHGTLYTHGSTSSASSSVALLVVSLLGLFGQLLATGAVFKLQLDAYLGRPHEIRESLEFAFAGHRLLSLLWVGIIATVMIVVGLILIIVPGIYLFVALSVAVPVLMLEGQKGMAAISRSMSLVSGRWWPTLGRLIVGLILYIVAVFVIGAIAGAIAHSTTNVTLYEVIQGLIGALISILLAPFFAAIINVTYIDLRVRKEGADHGTLISGGVPPVPPGVAPLPVEPVPAPPPGEPPASGSPGEPPATGSPGEPPPSQPPPSEPPPAPGA
jgi:uncharacterized membrane protein YeaQ/YmgE (transglycosylase-associated protein family)